MLSARTSQCILLLRSVGSTLCQVEETYGGEWYMSKRESFLKDSGVKIKMKTKNNI